MTHKISEKLILSQAIGMMSMAHTSSQIPSQSLQQCYTLGISDPGQGKMPNLILPPSKGTDGLYPGRCYDFHACEDQEMACLVDGAGSLKTEKTNEENKMKPDATYLIH